MLLITQEGNPGPVIDALLAIFGTEGVSLKPIRTLRLLQRLLKDSQQAQTPPTDASIDR